jgi:phosphotransferase system IIA component
MTKRISSVRLSASVVAVILLVGMCFLRPEIARSQASSATFYGNVIDPTSAAVPEANVTLVEQSTQATITKTTSASGDFAFTFVPVGVYTLKIDAKGFKSYVSTGLSLTAGQQIRQALKLELGAVTETVNVDAAPPLVNTVSSEQLQNYSITDARELPLQNRTSAAC